MAITDLLAVPHIARVRELDLERASPGPEVARALADCPALTGLRWLSLAFTELDAEGLRRVLWSPHLAGLTSLDLEHSHRDPPPRGIGDEGARRLASAPNLKRLTELNLSGNGLTDDGQRHLPETAALRNLTVLRLDKNWDVGDEGSRRWRGRPTSPGCVCYR